MAEMSMPPDSTCHGCGKPVAFADICARDHDTREHDYHVECVPRGYPNLVAMLDGMTSGRSTEWVMIRAELRRLLEVARGVRDSVGFTLNVPGLEDAPRCCNTPEDRRRAARALRNLRDALAEFPQ